MKRCLITGATGAIGPAAVSAFFDAGYRVRVLSRKPVARDDIETVVGDLLDPSAETATRDIDVVIHLAARLHTLEQPADEFERINVEGTRRLLAAAIESGVPRFVFASTIAVYGSGNGVIVDESTPPAPDTPYRRTKLEGEKLVLGTRIGVVLRLASVYGPHVKGNYRNLVKAIDRRRYVPVGSGHNRRTLVHEYDLGRALLLAAESNAVAGSVFNVTDGRFYALRDIVDAIASAVGGKPFRFHVPLFVARAGAAALDLVRPSMHARELLDKYVEDLAVDGSRFQRAAGFVPRIDLMSGWDATVRGLRADGAL
ncbi:MAG TPA: NAD-dependent epimerase/dehydratase family protein [Thermoanaerobaculia bacterium]|jgi:nucleoside-diphosphate-sugar epimerase|nr:NAD-dependent epimerase/dehydratase family protein [Thermoanaerobaculia bacterium]